MGMDSVELVMKVEEEFDLIITDDEAERIRTVGDFHDYIVASLLKNGRDADVQRVFEKLRDIICDQLGIKPEQVVPSARFVEDLRMD